MDLPQPQWNLKLAHEAEPRTLWGRDSGEQWLVSWGAEHRTQQPRSPPGAQFFPAPPPNITSPKVERRVLFDAL
jgi:hypothetical protein